MAQTKGLIRNLAVKLAAKNIIVNVISPQIIKRNALEHFLFLANEYVFINAHLSDWLES